jgi:hypothetical protein
MKTKEIKTYVNWKGSLNEYLKVGDLVDEEMTEYFINVLPPACWRSNLIQMGEPYSDAKDNNGKYRATYSTLQKTSEGWTYAGNCFRGTIDQGIEIDWVKFANKEV